MGVAGGTGCNSGPYSARWLLADSDSGREEGGAGAGGDIQGECAPPWMSLMALPLGLSLHPWPQSLLSPVFT